MVPTNLKTKSFTFVFGLALIICLGIFFFKKGEKRNDTIDRITKFSTEDPLLKLYKDTAQAQLYYLIQFMNEHDKGDSLFNYFVKSNFHEENHDEHMWTEVYEFKNDYFIGRLSNEPSSIKQIKFGDSVIVNRHDVEDWILKDFFTNTEVGGFSQQYLRSKAK